MLVGYARVSTEDQHLELQHDALAKAGCEKTFDEKVSSGAAARAGLANALQFVREGDVLVVWKLDRLGRSVKGLIELTEGLQKRGIGFKSLTESIDTTTAQGRLFFHIIAAFAQMERDLIRERTQAGLAAARARGRSGGRKPVMTQAKKEAAARLLADGRPPGEVATTLGVSRTTLYRWLPRGRAPA